MSDCHAPTAGGSFRCESGAPVIADAVPTHITTAQRRIVHDPTSPGGWTGTIIGAETRLAGRGPAHFWDASERQEVQTRIDILIVAGVRLYQEGLELALSSDPRFRVVASAANHTEGIARIASLPRCPDVAVIDVGPPLSFDSARALRIQAPQMHLLAVAIGGADDDVVSWAEAGVSGFVSRETPLNGLMQAIDSIATHGSVCAPDITVRLLRRLESVGSARWAPASTTLTPRERDVVGLIDQGQSNKEIARALHLSIATVKNHVHSILDKLQVSSRGQAAAAMRGTRIYKGD